MPKIDMKSALSFFYKTGQGTFNWRASSQPVFIQNYFLLKRKMDYFDNRDKCRKPGFLAVQDSSIGDIVSQ